MPRRSSSTTPPFSNRKASCGFSLSVVDAVRPMTATQHLKRRRRKNSHHPNNSCTAVANVFASLVRDAVVRVTVIRGRGP
ncbi:hypothetical protein CTA2_9811 [Colletotrichum tanaceti]|nr:hypothetical protein CTA2_9811 [Colletotrichum tanaceti]